MGPSGPARAGHTIELPEHHVDRPSREFLKWHLNESSQPDLAGQLRAVVAPTTQRVTAGAPRVRCFR